MYLSWEEIIKVRFDNQNLEYIQIYLICHLIPGVGNSTACAEFNFHMDPEAACIVLDSLNCPKTILPWECCIEECDNISLVIIIFFHKCKGRLTLFC